MTVEIFGRKMRRDTVEAMIEAMIEALDNQDGDIEAEPEADEDDERQLKAA